MDTLTYCSRDTLTEIADTIRGRTGGEETYKPSGMASALTDQFEAEDAAWAAYADANGSLVIPSGLTHIRDYAFFARNISSATIPEGVTSIGDFAFKGCYSLAHVTLPDGLESIGDNAFFNCIALTSITIPDTVTRIYSHAFRSCTSLASVNLPAGLTSIRSYAFSGTALTDITIPSSSVSIRPYAFAYCTKLANVTIESGVGYIQNYAFANCTNMQEYHLKPTTPPTLNDTDVFEGIPSNCIIYVPEGSLEAYQTANYWSTYADQMQEE